MKKIKYHGGTNEMAAKINTFFKEQDELTAGIIRHEAAKPTRRPSLKRCILNDIAAGIATEKAKPVAAQRRPYTLDDAMTGITRPLFTYSPAAKVAAPLLKLGNAKLDKSVAIFNLPAVVTCGRACVGCYALKSEKRFPAVKAARDRNLYASEADDFAQRVIDELSVMMWAGKIKAVRIHESGDFYSPAYVAKWVAIAKAFPALRFYAYTKREGVTVLGRSLNSLKKLPNFTLVNSSKFGAVNYGSLEELAAPLRQGAFLCPCGTAKDDGKGGICGQSCTYCQTKAAQLTGVVFVKH